MREVRNDHSDDPALSKIEISRHLIRRVIQFADGLHDPLPGLQLYVPFPAEYTRHRRGTHTGMPCHIMDRCHFSAPVTFYITNMIQFQKLFYKYFLCKIIFLPKRQGSVLCLHRLCPVLCPTEIRKERETGVSSLSPSKKGDRELTPVSSCLLAASCRSSPSRNRCEKTRHQPLIPDEAIPST